MVTSFASSLDIFIVAIFGVFDRLYWSRFADNGQTGRWHTGQGSALLPSSFRNGWVLSWRRFLFWFRSLLVSARKRRLMHVSLPLITPGGINQFLSNSLQRSYQWSPPCRYHFIYCRLQYRRNVCERVGVGTTVVVFSRLTRYLDKRTANFVNP